MAYDFDDYERDTSDSDYAEYEYTVREELDDIDRADATDEPHALPEFPARTAGESLQAYGSRALQFLLAYNCTAVLTDVDLELIGRAAILAGARPDLTTAVRTTLANVQYLASSMLAARRKLQAPVQPSAAPAGVDKPNLGPMAPVAVRPVVRPPSGEKVKVQF